MADPCGRVATGPTDPLRATVHYLRVEAEPVQRTHRPDLIPGTPGDVRLDGVGNIREKLDRTVTVVKFITTVDRPALLDVDAAIDASHREARGRARKSREIGQDSHQRLVYAIYKGHGPNPDISPRGDRQETQAEGNVIRTTAVAQFEIP